MLRHSADLAKYNAYSLVGHVFGRMVFVKIRDEATVELW